MVWPRAGNSTGSVGREKEVRADGTETTHTRAVCSTATCPSRGALKVITRSTGAPAQVAVSDVLGREIRRAGVSFARRVVATDTLYDARGQALKTSRPYVTGVAASTIKWHTFTYDAIGRPLTETAPDGQAVTRRAYAGLTTTLTNAGGAGEQTQVQRAGRTYPGHRCGRHPDGLHL